MKKLTLIAMAVVLSFAVFHSCNGPLTEEPAGDGLSLKSADNNGARSYIVVLNDAGLDAELATLNGYEPKQKAAKSAAERIMKRAGITDGEIGFVYGTALKGFSVKIAPGQLKKLQDDPSVSYIEEDQVVTLIEPLVKPTKGKPGSDPGTGGSTQEIPWGITRVGGAGNGAGKTAWIIDSGIDLDHPDLDVDVSRSQSFLGGIDANNPDDLNGHGTHVAGTIAAIDNSVGVIGVAAGATVVAVRVLDRRGSGSYSGVIAGVDYVGSNGANGDVANMSLGGPPSSALDNAIFEAAKGGVIFTLAAGNESDDANNYSPARVNGSNIYTISAMDSNDKWAYFSNYGNPPIEYCAPGYGIKSTYKNGGYATLSGTSMAAPHAAGVLLLGAAHTDSYVSGDPDKEADPIIHR